MEVGEAGKTISEFLAKLSPAQLDALYSDPASVRVILREAVPAVAQQLVLRLAFGGARPFQESVLRKWSKAERDTRDARDARDARDVLQRLRILIPSSAWMLHPDFQSCLVRSLTAPPTVTASASEAELVQHAAACWDVFLERLLGERSETTQLTTLADALKLRQEGMLTAAGFQFILDERQQQLWTLILAFLAKCADPLGPLQKIFAIGELKVGERKQELAGDETFVKLLLELGVLSPSAAVTPAGLALYQKHWSTVLSRSASESEGIVVESNFKVYCYTRSALRLRLLSYFCEVQTRLPNLAVAQLSADSVLRALKRGIRAANILRFLEAGAHPAAPAVPANVRGQLEAGTITKHIHL